MRKAQALFTTGGRGNGITVFRQKTLNDLTGFRVIINDQDRGAGPGLTQCLEFSPGMPFVSLHHVVQIAKEWIRQLQHCSSPPLDFYS